MKKTLEWIGAWGIATAYAAGTAVYANCYPSSVMGFIWNNIL